ncbi:hypothetical protein HOD08_04755 [bacterium]|nr:hypothetical protein [bacterium]
MVEKTEMTTQEESRFEQRKLFYISGMYASIIAAYSVLRPLKSSVFLGFVGVNYQPVAKMLLMCVSPLILFLYSKVIDRLKRSQIVALFLGFYILVCISFIGILLHPTIGLLNTTTSPNRIAGWLFYTCCDLFSVLAVGTFWAFTNSISSPKSSRRSYGKIVATSRVAGIFSPMIGLLVMWYSPFSERINIPIMLGLTGFFIAIALLFIFLLHKRIPKEYLAGYAEETLKKSETQIAKKKTGMFEGLKMLLSKPYVFGIFAVVYSFEIILTFTEFQWQRWMSSHTHNSVSGITKYMFYYTSAFQVVALAIAVFGTTNLLKKVGVRTCLLLTPIIVSILMFGVAVHQGFITLAITLIMLRALHYAFNQPVTEILYIPTTRDIQFKSKAWIESFGKPLSKASGSAYNYLYTLQSSFISAISASLLPATVAGIWVVVAFLIGKKYQDTVTSGRVIGAADVVDDPEDAEESEESNL